jgi:hypothetical protein
MIFKRRASCPICTAKETTFFRSCGGANTLIGRKCRNVFFSPSPNIDQLTAYYGAEYTADFDQLTKQTRNREYYREHVISLAIWAGVSVSELSICDYGCSYPMLLEVAMEMGVKEVLGIDWSDQAKLYGDRKGVKVISPHYISKVAKGRFNVLRFSHALEHTISPVEALTSASSLLCEGGLLHVTQPSFPCFKYEASNISPKDAVFPNHLHFFNPVSLYQLITRSLFTPICIYSHTNPEESFSYYRDSLDLNFSIKNTQHMDRFKGEGISILANVPFFLGEDAVVFAKKQ